MTAEERLSTFQKARSINAREICSAADLRLIAAEKPKKTDSKVAVRSVNIADRWRDMRKGFKDAESQWEYKRFAGKDPIGGWPRNDKRRSRK